MESKEIKVYGTLVNHTTIDPNDSTLYPRVDSQHNDSIAYAYQLYDDRFGASPAPENYQDNINKRVKGITYNNQDNSTTIHNLIVDGISGIKLGDLDDVTTTGEAAGDFLKFDGTQWVPAVIALSDIDGFDIIGTPSEGDIIKYVNNQWTFTKNKLDELYDVDITNKANGSILKWNSTSNKWEMDTDASGSALPAGLPGYVLKYINGEWQAAEDLVGATRMSELNDVDTTGLAVGKILKWNGTKWAIDTDETGGGGVSGATKLSDLSDVDSSVDNPDAGAVLTYDSESGKWKAISEEGGLSTIPSDATYHYYNQTYTYLTTISAQVAHDPTDHGFGAITNSSVDDVAGLPMYEKDYYYVYVLNSQDKALIPSDEIYSGVEYTNIDVDNLPHSVYPSGVSTYPINGTSYTNNTNGTIHEGSYSSSSYFVPSSVYDTITPNIISGGVHKPGILLGSNNTNSSISLHLENGGSTGTFNSIKAKVVNDYDTIGDDTGSYYGNIISVVKDGYSYGIFTTGGYTDYAQPLGFTSRFYKCLTTSNATAINRTYTSITESDFKAATSGFTIPAGASYIIVGPVSQKPADTITEKITTYESGDMGFTDVGKGLLIGEIVVNGTATNISTGYNHSYDYMTQITKDVAERIISMNMIVLEDGNPVHSNNGCALLVNNNNYYLYGSSAGGYTFPDGSSILYNGDKALFRVLLKK